MGRLLAVMGEAWRSVGTMLAMHFAASPPIGLIDAIIEAADRHPNDVRLQQRRAVAELDVREILGQRRFDA